MMLLVIFLCLIQNLYCLLDACWLYHYLLETSFQSTVFLDAQLVFLCGGCADAANLSASKSRLQNVCSVHASAACARAYKRMNLVDEKDDVGILLHLLHYSLHTLLKLSAVLCSSNHEREVERVDFLVEQLWNDVLRCYLLRQTFNDSAFAHAGLAYEYWIILLSAAQNLNDAFNLLLATYNVVEFAFCCLLRQVYGILV